MSKTDQSRHLPVVNIGMYTMLLAKTAKTCSAR